MQVTEQHSEGNFWSVLIWTSMEYEAVLLSMEYEPVPKRWKTPYPISASHATRFHNETLTYVGSYHIYYKGWNMDNDLQDSCT